MITNSKTTKTTAFITLLRALACLLIINSHCRDYYPIPFLAIGGGHGNAIFFILSGYCLAEIKLPFLQWYKKRLNRIIPITCIVLLLGIFIDGWSSLWGVSVWQIVLRYINRYWFVWAIVLYYVLFYALFQKQNERTALTAFAIYIAGYVLLYLFALNRRVFSVELEGFSLFKVYFYFGVFLVGGIIRLSYGDFWMQKIKPPFLVFLLLLSLLVWCGEYALIMVWDTGLALQFLIHLSVISFAVSTLLIALRFSDKFIIPGGYVGKFITGLAGSTLEIYLVQVTIVPLIPDWTFPLNWILFVGISICGGICLHFFYDKIKR